MLESNLRTASSLVSDWVRISRRRSTSDWRELKLLAFFSKSTECWVEACVAFSSVTSTSWSYCMISAGWSDQSFCIAPVLWEESAVFGSLSITHRDCQDRRQSVAYHWDSPQFVHPVARSRFRCHCCLEPFWHWYTHFVVLLNALKLNCLVETEFTKIKVSFRLLEASSWRSYSFLNVY